MDECLNILVKYNDLNNYKFTLQKQRKEIEEQEKQIKDPNKKDQWIKSKQNEFKELQGSLEIKLNKAREKLIAEKLRTIPNIQKEIERMVGLEESEEQAACLSPEIISLSYAFHEIRSILIFLDYLAKKNKKGGLDKWLMK